MRSIAANVYMEDDYSVFRRLDENRSVLEGRVEKLVASLSEGEIMNPIVVNEKMQIIDGQGRYEAKKALGLPIYYVVANGAGIDECRRMNRYNTNWNLDDYVESYANGGNDNYKRLVDMAHESGRSYSIALIISGKDRIGGCDSPVLKGTLQFSEDDHIRSIVLSEKIDEIGKTLTGGDPIGKRTFIRAARFVVETAGYSHKTMLNHCAQLRHTYKTQADVESQIMEFERIYNYGMKKTYIGFHDDWVTRVKKGRWKNTYIRKNGAKDVSSLKGNRR